jgi:hypothetical protein
MLALLARCAVAWLLALLPALACADSLKAVVTPLSIHPRSNAPVIFDIRLQREGAGLVEGHLELTFIISGHVIHQRSQELALAAGAQNFRIFTPPMPSGQSFSNLEARMRFVTKTGSSIDLGRSKLEAETGEARKFVIAVCDGHNAGMRDGALWQSLRFESIFPGSARTAPAFLDAADFPSNPLHLTAFDIVLLEGEGLAGLREKQLAALAHWVEAGGSLCVVPGAGMKEEHARFLNAFAAAGPPLGRISDLGAWTSDDAQPRLLRAGLGRVVVGTASGDEAARIHAGRRAAAFLSQVSAKFAEPIIAGENPPEDLAKVLKKGEEVSPLNYSMGSMLSSLLPDSMRLISPWVVVLLLVGFLVVVGPADWIILGRLRRRRWTWILFPLAAAGCTGLIVLEAGRSLGHEDPRAVVIFTDLGPGGRVLRESRYEMLICGKDKTVTSEFQNALVFSSDFARNLEDAEGWFEGQVPLRYTLRQPFRQWSPQINRVTSLEASAPVPGLPWDRIDAQVFDAKAASFAALLPDWNYTIFFGRQKVQGRGEKAPLHPVFSVESFFVAPARRAAPHGGRAFDDLQMLDPENDRERLLVLYRPIPNGMQIYRRLYTKPE